MAIAYFVTHPEVAIDAAVPVPRWHLADKGISRMRSFARTSEMANIKAVWASNETKAIEGAGILAAPFGLPVHVDAGLAENDRSATGFVPPDKFQLYADAFFAKPDESFKGWERAVDAQTRIVAAVERILQNHSGGDIALVSHGGVGTLLLCHYLGEPISRRRDQPFQGHFWAFDARSGHVLHDWRIIAPL